MYHTAPITPIAKIAEPKIYKTKACASCSGSLRFKVAKSSIAPTIEISTNIKISFEAFDIFDATIYKDTPPKQSAFHFSI